MQSESIVIKNIGELLKNVEVVNFRTARLTTVGENYGSIMLKVDMELKNREDGKEKTIQGVAKLIPSHERVRQIFNVQVTFKNELAFYSVVIPTLVEFQKENNMPNISRCFPELLGGRINLNGTDVVDEDAVILLENLKAAGYKNADRCEGFDLEASKLILQDLAAFHAVPLALKLRKPEVFEQNIRPYCHPFHPPLDNFKTLTKMLGRVLEENEKCRPLIPRIKPWGTNLESREAREPFATVVHNDLWVNNTMQRYENDLPVSNKFVDFQAVDYGSPAADVFFLLFTSVQLPVLVKHIDYFLQYYHEYFTQILDKLGCDTKPFNFGAFMEEMRMEAEYEFSHAIAFSTFIVNLQKQSREFDGEEIDEDKMLKLVSPENRARAQFIALECDRRGWLY